MSVLSHSSQNDFVFFFSVLPLVLNLKWMKFNSIGKNTTWKSFINSLWNDKLAVCEQQTTEKKETTKIMKCHQKNWNIISMKVTVKVDDHKHKHSKIVILKMTKNDDVCDDLFQMTSRKKNKNSNKNNWKLTKWRGEVIFTIFRLSAKKAGKYAKQESSGTFHTEGALIDQTV